MTFLVLSLKLWAGPLQDAAEDGDIDRVRELLSGSMSVDDRGDSGSTPLHLAAGQGHLNVVTYLVTEGADLHARTHYYPLPGLTVVHLAARENHLPVLSYLLEQGAEVNPDNSPSGNTPLHLAAEKGYLGIVKHLVQRGADFNLTNNNNRTPLDLARREGHREVIQFLENYIVAQRSTYNTVHLISNEPNEVFYEAAQNGDIEAIQRFLARGFSINIKDEWGNAALHWAAIRGYLHIVECLLSNGASIDITDNAWQTPLHWAARNGQLEVVKLLLAKGANINARSGNGRTPIQFAEQFNQLDVLRYLNEFLNLQATRGAQGEDRREQDHDMVRNNLPLPSPLPSPVCMPIIAASHLGDISELEVTEDSEFYHNEAQNNTSFLSLPEQELLITYFLRRFTDI